MKKSIKIIARSIVAFAVAAIMALSAVHAAEPAQDVGLTYEELSSLRLELIKELLEGFELAEESDILIAYVEMINALVEIFGFEAPLIGLLILDDFLEFLDGGDSLFVELFTHIIAIRLEVSE